MNATVEWVEETHSTNSLIKYNAPEGLFIAARKQTAGRGQRGNSWEAEPYRNLSFSFCLRPQDMPAIKQFEISMLVATACCDFLRQLVITPDWLRLKWPNDIYFGDRKLGGILIEQSVCSGLIEQCTVGIGINVNQSTFMSDAPNPISLIHIIGHEMQLEPLMNDLAEFIMARYHEYMELRAVQQLTAYYTAHLWRNEGFHKFRDCICDETFTAEFVDVKDSGRIFLRDNRGNLRDYTFKEIEWL